MLADKSSQGDSWNLWRYRVPLALPSDHSQGYYLFSVPWEVLKLSEPGFADLRVVDDVGIEVPYAIISGIREEKNNQYTRIPFEEIVFSPFEYTQAQLDLQPNMETLSAGGGWKHFRVGLPMIQEEFVYQVMIEGSSDCRRTLPNGGFCSSIPW